MQKFIPYIYTFFLFGISNGIFAQKLHLKTAATATLEDDFLSKINQSKSFNTAKEIYSEITLISERLKQHGYFLNTNDSITKNDSIYTAYFSLGKKTETAILKIPKYFILKKKNFKIDNNTTTIPISELSNLLSSISKKLDQDGQSFSEVKLKNIKLEGEVLFADISIKPSNKRTINKIIVKGYDAFSKAHLKHYLNIKSNTVFNQQKLKEISKGIQSLDFVSEIKPPEVLFSKDSTLLYIYVKKDRRNSFDGLVSFASKENGDGILFNGYVDLKLNNILNTGENFELFWKANGKERQQFKVTTRIPYIFNTAFTPELSFRIYKHDSTYINTKFHGGVSYNLNTKTTLGLTFDAENSDNLLQDDLGSSSSSSSSSSSNIKTFENSFFGIDLSYRIPNNDFFNTDKFSLNINPSFGNRKTEDNNTSQFKLSFTTALLWNLNYRNSFFIKNETGYLNSDDFIENEVFRIGGINSIRGFNEQSIFTSQYSFLNVEYRYLTSNNSYLYSISDFGNIKTINAKNENVFGLGLGYLLTLKNTQINLGYALGKTSSSNFDFYDSKLLIKMVSFF